MGSGILWGVWLAPVKLPGKHILPADAYSVDQAGSSNYLVKDVLTQKNSIRKRTGGRAR